MPFVVHLLRRSAETLVKANQGFFASIGCQDQEQKQQSINSCHVLIPLSNQLKVESHQEGTQKATLDFTWSAMRAVESCIHY